MSFSLHITEDAGFTPRVPVPYDGGSTFAHSATRFDVKAQRGAQAEAYRVGTSIGRALRVEWEGSEGAELGVGTYRAT